MIVVDATAWVDRLRGVLPAELSAAIRAEGCMSPAHVDSEVGSALIRLERRGELGNGAARMLIEKFSAHPVERVLQADDAVHAADILDNSTYADAWYLALAMRVDCPLMTLDGGMKTVARVHGITVIDA